MTAKVFESLLELDGALADAGVPPLSDYWRAEAERFYLHPTAKLWIEECGRGGAKSQVSVKTAIAEVLAGEFRIPPGERHFFAHVSENVDEAKKTLRILTDYLRLLGIPFDPVDGAIELAELSRGFKVFAARIGAVSGFRCIGWTLDEAAKLNFNGVNPSSEIVASMKAMTVTHPHARGRVFSSPMGKSGFFWDQCAKGTTGAQVRGGPTPSWVANPGGITYERTLELEDDPKTHAREYGAIAQDNVSAALDSDLVRACIRPFRRGRALGPVVMAADTSQGRVDDWAWLAAQWVQPELSEFELYDYSPGEHGGWIANFDTDGPAVRRNPPPPLPPPEMQVFEIGAFEGGFANRPTPQEGSWSDHIIAHMADLAARHGVRQIFADAYGGLTTKAAFQKHGIEWVIQDWTSPSIREAMIVLRRWLADRQLVIQPGPEGDKLVNELIALDDVIQASGASSFGARKGHDDRAAALRNLAHAAATLSLPGAPLRFDRRLHSLGQYR